MVKLAAVGKPIMLNSYTVIFLTFFPPVATYMFTQISMFTAEKGRGGGLGARDISKSMDISIETF